MPNTPDSSPDPAPKPLPRAPMSPTKPFVFDDPVAKPNTYEDVYGPRIVPAPVPVIPPAEHGPTVIPTPAGPQRQQRP